MSGFATVYTTSRHLAVSLTPVMSCYDCTNSNPLMQQKLYPLNLHNLLRLCMLVHGKIVAQVNPPHLRIAPQFPRSTCPEYLALINDVRAIRH
jgi:hypothetical protein